MEITKKIKKNIILSKYSTFKIGGLADFFIEVETVDELIRAILWANNKKIKFYIIGGGSNILINDKVVSGLVIKVAIDKIEIKKNQLKVGAGIRLNQAVILAYENSLSGLEWAVGIPGSIGGATRGNAGAFGGSMADIIDKISVYDTVKKSVVEYKKTNSHFKYRNSIFKLKNNLIVLEVVLKLTKGKRSDIKIKMDNILKKRSINLPKGLSAGSVFKNITIKDLSANNRSLLIKAVTEKVIKDKKVPVGWIIDQLDLKGKVIGGAKISNEHSNVIVNWKDATSDDIVTLISFIKTKVRNKLQLQLNEEIEYIGF
jgi:UDP-N-acetylmuramate dehydrogenase